MHRPVVRQLLVEKIELRLADAHDPRCLAVCREKVLNLREASQAHRVGRQQLVTALIHKEAERQIPVGQLKVGHIQRAIRVMK